MTPDPDDPSWYLVQLKPHGARIAERNLRRQGFQTFLPIEEVTTRRRGTFATTRRPLFPGYLFVALDPKTGQWSSINSTSGVARLVSFGTAPANVPKGLVDSLMSQADADGTLLPQDNLEAGDGVTITRGPFTDFVAQVTALSPDRRVWVLLEVMGRQTHVALTRDHLRLT